MDLKLALLAVLASIISLSNAQNPFILFTGSKVLRPGLDYDFGVSSGNLQRSLSLNVTLTGTSDSGAAVELKLVNQVIPPNFVRSLKLRTNTLPPGTYSLIFDTFNRVTNTFYQDVQSLTYRKKKFSSFIYTDKGMYKPEDTVNFSVFAVDSETRPYNPTGGSVTIYNTDNIKIKTFANVTFVRGKFKGSLDLSSLAAEGVWRIDFDAEGESTEKQFEVKKYVLPTYSVSISLPDRAPIPDVTFPVTIEALYTFGEAVQGEAVVTFYINEWIWDWQEPPIFIDPPFYEEPLPMEEPQFIEEPVAPAPLPLEPAPEGDRAKRQAMMAPDYWWGGGSGRQVRRTLFTKTVPINSKSVTFDVNIASELGITYETTVNAEVVFTEALTGKSVSAIGAVYIAQYGYELLITGSDNFLPNTTYSATVAMRRIGTGAPAPAGLPISVNFQEGSWNCFYDPTLGYWTCPQKSQKFDVVTDASGSVTISYTPGKSDYFYISASSSVASSAYKYPQKPQVRVVGILDATVITKKPKVGSPVSIRIDTSSATLTRVNCHLISKGVLTIRQISLVNQTATFTFTPTFFNAPKTDIIFYYLDQSGSVVSTRVTLNLNEDLPNFVELTPTAAVVKPGRNVNLKVNSNRFSTVSLFGQDKASLLLRGGNDFKKTEVFGALSAYDEVIYSGWDWRWWLRQDLQNFDNANVFAKKRTIDNVITDYEEGPTTSEPEPDYMWAEGPAGPSEGPMEMPMAPNAPGMQGGDVEPDAVTPEIRKDFSEVILIPDVEVVNKKPLGGGLFDERIGEAFTSFKMPDSITTFELRGVAMSNAHGLGLTEKPAEVKVFLDFFLALSLPYNVKRGETVPLKINIFSYLTRNQSVTVSFARSDSDFAVLNPSTDRWTTTISSYRQTITIAPNNPRSLKIVLRPNKLGSLRIQINATGTVASDALEKFLKVIPEGIPKTITNSVLVMKNDSASTYTSTLRCDLPPTAVNDTTSASASVAGDLLGPMIDGLENLIQMSYGCGEQNLLNFVPSLFALRYLESTGQLTASLRAKAISFAEDGYQRQLSYAHPNGGYSAFGTSDPSASTWLTAFTVLGFELASDYITVDAQVIQRAFNFFISKQNADGSFREDGNVIHKDMQGGSSNGLPLTAFVSIVLSESLDKFPQYTTARNKALDYLALNIDLTNIYAVCISTLALQLGNHASFSTLFNQLIALGVETADQMSWSKPLPPPSSSDPWWYYSQPRSLDIEMTAYGLRVLSSADIAKALKSTKWLVSKKNSFGGYGSTQDTVQALNALSIFGTLYNAQSGTIDLRLTPNVGSVINAQVNPANKLVVQDFVLNPLARQLEVFSGVNSVGSAIVTLVCNFYEVSAETAPRFNIRTRLIEPCLPLVREVCISYIPEGDDIESNMALVKITLPSGFVYDNDQDDPAGSSLIEIADNGNTVNIYFNSFNAKEKCFTVEAAQANVVENLADSYIEVTDYYDTFKKSQITYSTPKSLSYCPRPVKN